MEIPILLMAAGMVIAILLPRLPPLGQKILVGIAAVATLSGLYYMIVIPGWTPGEQGRLKTPWNLLIFLLLAAVIIAGVAAFLLA